MLLEVMGPSGVGKTSVLNVVSTNPSSGRVFYPIELARNIKSIKSLLGEEDVRFRMDYTFPTDFVYGCIGVINRGNLKPSQKLLAFKMLDNTLERYILTKFLNKDEQLVHDELLIHRGFALLSNSDNLLVNAKWYFSNVPTPDAVIFMHADPEVVARRVLERGSVINSYRYKNELEIKEVIDRSYEMYEIAIDVLRKRGVIVVSVDANGPLEEVVTRVEQSIEYIFNLSELDRAQQSIKQRLVSSSSSFKISNGRHTLKTQGVIYCSFNTPKLTVMREEAQRDAYTRLKQFIKEEHKLEGSSVLDLGCNNGAILFELTNYKIGSGLGIEFDEDKVQVAKDIAKLNCFAYLDFRIGDIDLVEPSIGDFDFVFALAIEKHIKNPKRLYRLLSQVTKKAVFFEGNAGCDIDSVKIELFSVGFREVELLGMCCDDIRPENNKRPLLVAYK